MIKSMSYAMFILLSHYKTFPLAWIRGCSAPAFGRLGKIVTMRIVCLNLAMTHTLHAFSSALFAGKNPHFSPSRQDAGCQWGNHTWFHARPVAPRTAQ